MKSCFVRYSVCMSERVVLMCIFFFQAEDGIRDLVRSRGLGDVYKRQVEDDVHGVIQVGLLAEDVQGAALDAFGGEGGAGPVSYTHLTLPTSDLV